MQDLTVALSDFESQYDSHLLHMRGLSRSTRRLRFLTLVHAGLDGDEKNGENMARLMARL